MGSPHDPPESRPNPHHRQQARGKPPVTPAQPENADAAKPERVETPVNMGLLNLWVVLYGFVGTQLAWTLRPFFGDPGSPFEIFRRIESNFYINIIHSLMNALS